MKYKIGTLSELLGISSETIRLYEREGIIQAKREQSSGYRFFRHLDLTALIRARTYHNYGFSTKETERLINSTNLQDIQEMYQKREQALEREILIKRYTLAYLRKMTALISSAETQHHTCRIITSPHFYRLEFMESDRLQILKKDYPIFTRWSECTPFVAISHRSILEDLKLGKTHQVTALMIEKEYLDLFDLPIQHPLIHEFQPCRCIYTIVEEAGDQFDDVACLQHVFAYAQQNHLQIIKDPITRTFVSYDKKNQYVRCREVWIPVA